MAQVDNAIWNVEMTARAASTLESGRPRFKPQGGERPYLCCGKPGEGCKSLATHSYGLPDPKYQEYAAMPGGSPDAPRRRAVALDCEMALVRTTTVPYMASELILFCAVDYLTGETLINTHVSPGRTVVDWCTSYSGVDAHSMAEAEAQGQTLKGWQEARFELWRYINADTILVGQSLQHDLDVLRIIHSKAVDSAILTKLAVGFECTREWSLKTLCDELLGKNIQTRGKKGHICFEDTFAAREVVLLCCQYPERLEAWAMVKRKQQEEQQRIQKNASEKVKREKAKISEEQQKVREEVLEKAKCEKAKLKEEQRRAREKALEKQKFEKAMVREEHRKAFDEVVEEAMTARTREKDRLHNFQKESTNSSKSTVIEETRLRTQERLGNEEVQDEARQEIWREKRQRELHKQQEKYQTRFQFRPERSVSSAPLIGSHAPIDDHADNDGEALQQSLSSVGTMDLLNGDPSNDGQASSQLDIAEEVAAAFQPTLNKILDLIIAQSSRVI
ncbi:hypothetical protein MMC11_001322 [Xylographa trunciseda]|nr:hypothetical protein [Xylographa trunciseda]